MYGKILAGIPLGSSPIIPEGCAPMGLKYLKLAMRHLFGFFKYRSLSKFSIVSFVLPYGLIGLTSDPS